MNSGPLPYQGSALPLSYYSVGLRAENGAQTRDPQLGRLVLYQLSYFRKTVLKWVVMDSNHRSRKTADLQSAPFGHSGNHPYTTNPSLRFMNLRDVFAFIELRASCRIRTNDPEITNHVLWPTELKRQILAADYDYNRTCCKTAAKILFIFLISKTFNQFFQ